MEQELAEAHRREAATAAVLKGISRSTFNLQDVLDGVVKSAVRLTDAETRQDGKVYRAAAIYDPYPEFVDAVKQRPIPQGRQSATGRAVIERRAIHIHDVFDDPDYTWVGIQAVRSPTELRPVLDSIAATAARLCGSVDALVWTEACRGCERQTATSEVLSVISRSPGNLETIFGVCKAKVHFFFSITQPFGKSNEHPPVGCMIRSARF